jgi:uncharacterized protein (TIGR02217 family)
MSFFEQRFDERLSYGARGGPVWSTNRVVTQSGRRFVNQNWRYPLHRYDVSHAVKSADDFDVVRAMFYNVAGAFDGFRFKDWSDYKLTRSNSEISDSIGSPSEWQIYRLYTVGARTFRRPIFKPCASPAMIVWRTRSGTLSQATATVNTATGKVSITGHQAGDTYAAQGEFDVPVAFADDAMQSEIVDQDADGMLLRWSSITLEEIRIEE